MDIGSVSKEKAEILIKQAKEFIELGMCLNLNSAIECRQLILDQLAIKSPEEFK